MSTRETASRAASTTHEEQAGRFTGRAGGPDAHLLALQRGAGNQFVQRMLRASTPPPPRGRRAAPITRGRAGPTIQRYRVGLPGSADATALVGWLNSSGPHSPAWALTTPTFTRSGAPLVETVENESEDSDSEAEAEYTVTFPTATVTVSTRVDMPNWTASSPPMQAAWNAMHGQLRTHEAEHEAIAERWKTLLQERIREFSTTVYGGTESAARRQALADLAQDWETWMGEHQADQEAIDPYYATLSAPAEEEEDAEAETATGIEAHGETS